MTGPPTRRPVISSGSSPPLSSPHAPRRRLAHPTRQLSPARRFPCPGWHLCRYAAAPPSRYGQRVQGTRTGTRTAAGPGHPLGVAGELAQAYAAAAAAPPVQPDTIRAPTLLRIRRSGDDSIPTPEPGAPRLVLGADRQPTPRTTGARPASSPRHPPAAGKAGCPIATRWGRRSQCLPRAEPRPRRRRYRPLKSEADALTWPGNRAHRQVWAARGSRGVRRTPDRSRNAVDSSGSDGTAERTPAGRAPAGSG